MKQRTGSCGICGKTISIDHNRRYCSWDCIAEAKRRCAKIYADMKSGFKRRDYKRRDKNHKNIVMSADQKATAGKTVECLCCGRSFVSSHKGNRLCWYCRDQEQPPEATRINL